MMKPFKELSDERKGEIASELMWEDWHDCVINDFKEEMEALGFADVEVQFSGFWSQGDGASFTGDLDFGTFFNAKHSDMIFNFSGKETELSAVVSILLDGLDQSLISTIMGPEFDSRFVIKELAESGLWTVTLSRNSSHYVHHNTVAFDIHQEDCELAESEDDVDFSQFTVTDNHANEIYKFTSFLTLYMRNWKDSVCKDLYNRLEKDYESIIKQMIEDYEEENDEWEE